MVSLTKKALTTFFSPQLILQKLNSKKPIIFKVPEGGPTFSKGGGGLTFSRGSNCLFPIETHITCADFPGGGLDPLPPLDPHLSSAEMFKKPL